MIKAPTDYTTDQIYNDVLFLGERLKSLEDMMQDTLESIADIGLDLYSLPDPTKFAGVLTRFILKRIPFKDLRRFKRFRSELTKAQEEIEGLREHYTTNTLPVINKLLEKKVGKQGKFTNYDTN